METANVNQFDNFGPYEHYVVEVHGIECRVYALKEVADTAIYQAVDELAGIARRPS